MRYIANCSFGKDSLAMVLFLMNNNYPLDEVIFYDTGMEFDAIYKNRDKLKPILKERGITFTELKPPRPFIYDMLEKPIRTRNQHPKCGYGWCGGACRWGTAYKQQTIDGYLAKYSAEGYKQYVGIAYDEPDRIREKLYPLYDNKMTEKDCLAYCRSLGWTWPEGDIDLYDVLDRVSCWCCANKNKKELYNIWKYLPQYWQRLLDLQAKIDKPMKRYKNQKYGDYGNLYTLGEIFKTSEPAKAM